jgi:peptidoglycan/LPS O-acetylase OafA/YrhL
MTEPHVATSAPASTRRRLASLDLFRFFAAFAVVLYHYIDHPDGAATLSLAQAVAEHAYLGVNLFFIISGFVVLWSTQGRSPRDFVRSRALRLYPEYWLAVLISAFVFIRFGQELGKDLDLRTILLNLTMIPQYLGAQYVDGVYWTLGVEIKFYALVFVLLLAGGMRHVERWLIAWLALAVGVMFADLGPLRVLVVHPNGPLFIAGCMFYLVLERGWSAARVLVLLACLGLGINQSIIDMAGWVDPARITAITRVATGAAIVAFFGAFAWVVSSRGEFPYAKVAASLGALTYPLYLLHNAGKVLFLDGSFPVPALAIPVAIVFSVVLSFVVTRVAERWITPALRSALLLVLGPPAQASRHAGTDAPGAAPAHS